jgi:hypothetical protein
MAVYEIPTAPGVPFYTQVTELDGVEYRLTFSWNGREGAWYLTIANLQDTIIRAGIKLVPNWPLLRKVRHEKRPPGELMALDDAGVGITLDSLGTDVVLLYGDQETMSSG